MSRGPGKWQAAILDDLTRLDYFALTARFAARLGRPLGPAEASALHRAAKRLQRKGACRTALVLWHDPSCYLTIVSRPDSGILDRISVERVPGEGTRSTLIKGSLRQLAAANGLSKTQIVRDLADARAECLH